MLFIHFRHACTNFITNIIFIIFMTKKIKIFLPVPAYDELMLQYKGKEQDLRKVVFGLVLPMIKSSKMSKLNQSVSARIVVDGKTVLEKFEFKLIDFKKFKIESSDSWIPEEMKDEPYKVYELSISERAYEELEFFSQLMMIRMDCYNQSLDKESPDYEKQVAKLPVCVEQVIQDGVMQQLIDMVTKNIENDFNQEFDKMNVAPKIKGTR